MSDNILDKLQNGHYTDENVDIKFSAHDAFLE